MKNNKKYKYIKLIISFGFLLQIILIPPSYAQTYVSGVISNTTNWTKSGSPYILEDDIFIRGTELKIDPGVTVNLGKFSININTMKNNFGSYLNSYLNAEEVKFISKSNSGSINYNGQCHLYNCGYAQGILNNCQFENIVFLFEDYSRPRITNSALCSYIEGIIAFTFSNKSTATIENNLMEGYNYPIKFSGSCSPVIFENDIKNCINKKIAISGEFEGDMSIKDYGYEYVLTDYWKWIGGTSINIEKDVFIDLNGNNINFSTSLGSYYGGTMNSSLKATNVCFINTNEQYGSIHYGGPNSRATFICDSCDFQNVLFSPVRNSYTDFSNCKIENEKFSGTAFNLYGTINLKNSIISGYERAFKIIENTGKNFLDSCDFVMNPHGIENQQEVVFEAKDCFWGHSTGPYHPTKNPDGQGCEVSDYVDFEPWLSEPSSSENILTGIVFDEERNPIQNAMVTVNGIEERSFETNEKGVFYFMGLDDNSTIVISKSGYLTKTIYNVDLSDSYRELDIDLNPVSTDLVFSNIQFNRNSFNNDYNFALSPTSFYRHEYIESNDEFNFISLLNSGLWTQVDITNNSSEKERYELYIGLMSPSGKEYRQQPYYPSGRLNPGETITKLERIGGYDLIKWPWQKVEEGEWLLNLQINNKNFDWDNPDYKFLVTNEKIEKENKHTWEAFNNSLVLPNSETYNNLSAAERAKRLGYWQAAIELATLFGSVSAGNGNTYSADPYRAMQEVDDFKLAPLKAANIKTEILNDLTPNFYTVKLDWEINKYERANQFFDRAVIVLSLEGDCSYINSSADDIIETVDEFGNPIKLFLWVFEGIDKQIHEAVNSLELLINTNSFVNYQSTLYLQYGPFANPPKNEPESGRISEEGPLYDYIKWKHDEEQIYYYTISLDLNNGKIFNSYLNNSFDYWSSEGREYNFTLNTASINSSLKYFKLNKLISSFKSNKSSSNGSDSSFIVSDINNNAILPNIGLIGNAINIDSTLSTYFPIDLTISYKDEEIHSIHEDSLVVIKLNPSGTYQILSDFVINLDSNQISTMINKPGTYQIGYKGLKPINIECYSENLVDTFLVSLYHSGILIDSILTSKNNIKFSNIMSGNYRVKAKSTYYSKEKSIEFEHFCNDPNDTLIYYFRDKPDAPEIKNIIRKDSILICQFNLNPAAEYSAIKIYYDSVSNPSEYNGKLIEEANSPFIYNYQSFIELGIKENIDIFIRFSFIDSNNIEGIQTKEYYLPIYIPKPQINDTSLCLCNDSIVLKAIGDSIQWYGNELLTDNLGFGDNITVNYDSAGIYEYWLTQKRKGVVSSSKHISVTVFDAYNIQIDTSICEGEICFAEGKYQTESGTFYDTLNTIHGCDSVIITNLTVNQTYEITENVSICEGDDYYVEGRYQSESGTYYDTLSTIYGCDSLMTTELTVNQAYEISEDVSICEDEQYYAEGEYQTESGTFYDTLNTIHGCDSVIITNLTVNSTYETTEDVSICEGGDYYAGGSYQSESGTYYDTLITVNGCDSVIMTELTVNPTYEINKDVLICEGDTYYVEGEYRSVSGVYYDTLKTINDCDSIIVTGLVVNQNPGIYLGNDTTIEFNESLVLTPGEGYEFYEWYDGSNHSNYSVDSTLGSGDHSIWVQVEDQNQCTDRDTIIVTINQKAVTGLLSGIKLENIRIYPNPTEGKIIIEGPLGNIQVSIVNTTGQVILNEKLSGLSRKSINLRNIPNGVYFLRLEYKEFQKNIKIIKE
jgi:hypothetical protein